MAFPVPASASLTVEKVTPSVLPLAVSLSLTLVAISLIHAGLTAYFYQITRRGKAIEPGERVHCPRAVVILALRGPDAYLKQALQGLFTQDYGNYQIRIVVDSEQDPAYAVVEQTMRDCRAENVSVDVLRTRSSVCSLKCNALAQAVAELDDSCEIVAFMDADVVPHASWLRELVAPFADQRVGATTGNRWYIPEQRLWGSLVRTAWNGSAFMQMAVFRIAWGGTMAIRHSIVRDTRLTQKWATSFNDDIVMAEAVRERGLELRFVPSLVIVNREDTSWQACQSWVTRQLFHTRHYQRNWMVVAGLGLASMVLIGAVCALMPICLWRGETAAALAAFTGLGAYMSMMAVLWLIISHRVRQLVGGRVERVNVIGWLRLVPAVIGAHAVYGVGLCSAMSRRTITWRGVTYRVHGPWDVQIVDDNPITATATAVSQQAGLSL